MQILPCVKVEISVINTLVRVDLQKTQVIYKLNPLYWAQYEFCPQALKTYWSVGGGVLVVWVKSQDVLTQLKQFEADKIKVSLTHCCSLAVTSRPWRVSQDSGEFRVFKKSVGEQNLKKYHALSGYGLEVVEYVEQ